MPIIIAFDSSTKPFRIYILRLAQEREVLQGMIATLATRNAGSGRRKIIL